MEILLYDHSTSIGVVVWIKNVPSRPMFFNTWCPVVMPFEEVMEHLDLEPWWMKYLNGKGFESL